MWAPSSSVIGCSDLGAYIGHMEESEGQKNVHSEEEASSLVSITDSRTTLASSYLNASDPFKIATGEESKVSSTTTLC